MVFKLCVIGNELYGDAYQKRSARKLKLEIKGKDSNKSKF